MVHEEEEEEKKEKVEEEREEEEVQPRDPCLPWRGILGPGHTPR